MEHKFTIGNWVNEPFPMQVVSVFQDEIYCNFEGNEGDVFEFKNEDVKPIQLTPEVLEKCGFKKDRNGYSLDDMYNLSFAITKNGDFLACFLDRSLDLIIHHLHQLQNLYFALTGEELIYKP